MSETRTNTALVQLTAGNIANHHIYLRTCSHLIPDDTIGGSNRHSAGSPIRVQFVPGPSIDTDVAGDKMIFRDRKAVKQFFADSDAQPGDSVEISRESERVISVKLVRR